LVGVERFDKRERRRLETLLPTTRPLRSLFLIGSRPIRSAGILRQGGACGKHRYKC
jgi:hypothetical protein